MGSAYNLGLMDVGFIGLVAPTPDDKKGYRIRGAFRLSRQTKCTASLPPQVLTADPKPGKVTTPKAWVF